MCTGVCTHVLTCMSICACECVYLCVCAVGACICVYTCMFVCTNILRSTQNAQRSRLGMEKVKNPGLRVVSLFAIRTRALKSSRASCHPSSGQGTSNPGRVYPPSAECAKSSFFTDCLPSFCLRERPDGGGQRRGRRSLSCPPGCQP